MKILIGADFVPTVTNEQLFMNGDTKYLLGEELCQLLSSADYRIFNLEVPLTDSETPIPKSGPNLIANTEATNLYEKINVDLFTLANNHIMDQGIEGYESTLAALRKKGIGFVGCADNLNTAIKPKVIDINGEKIGIYACTEHEFSIASDDTPGANPFDPLESYDHVYSLKQQCDYVIVLYHGGKEHYRYPSPDLQRYCRKFIEKGANIVLCQHSHCIGCKEDYKKGTIVYGQGNFLFDHSDREEWQTSLLIEITDDGVNYIPLVKLKNTVRLADKEKAETILGQFAKRSQDIQEIGFIGTAYSEFAESMLDGYLWQLAGASNSKILRVINKLSGYGFYKRYVKSKYNKQQQLNLLNYFVCEAHREVIVASLNNRTR